MRDQTFDYMKGIGILAMIIGHSIIPSIVDRVIFAWHMPMFFIISGYFYKNVDSKTMFIKNWKGLLKPYLVTSFLLVFIGYAKKEEGWDSISSALLSMLVASGSKGNPTSLANYFIGALWFLLAMFWCRTFYNLIQCKCKSEMAWGGGGNRSVLTFSIFGELHFITIEHSSRSRSNVVFYDRP